MRYCERWVCHILLALLAASASMGVAALELETVEETMEAEPAEALAGLVLRIRLADGQDGIRLEANAPVTLSGPGGDIELPAGDIHVEAASHTPAETRYDVFARSFANSRLEEARAAMRDWRQKGYEAVLETVGRRFQLASGEVVDNTTLWLRLGRYENQQAAERVQEAMRERDVVPWIQRRVVQAGRASVLVHAGGQTLGRITCPIRLEADAPLTVHNMNHRLWDPKTATRRYRGALEIAAGIEEGLSLIEETGVEDYLCGVVPAEMPDLWPAEALKAQAVAARTEVLAALGLRHLSENIDFCGTEHCRAYLGWDTQKQASARAVKAVTGLVLISGGRFAPTVYSANCGGWTANNDTVWSGPPNPALRAVCDMPSSGAYGTMLTESELHSWLHTSPDAYCGGNPDHFRWRRELSRAEVTRLVNEKHAIGPVRTLAAGERGPSGRLKWLRITGEHGEAVVHKELAIRRLLGGLPSGLFVIESDADTFTFIGGGRGHGVGMCQGGARGMALRGTTYSGILNHYYTDTTITKVD